MGVDCYGWVEVGDPYWHRTGPPRSENMWYGVVRITEIVERNYRVYGFFFDVHNPARIYTGVASWRGLPPDVSQEVLTESRERVELGAPTWILWSEVKASQWQAHIELSPGWELLFAIMEHLAAHYGDARVRLVIWFDNSAFLD